MANQDLLLSICADQPYARVQLHDGARRDVEAAHKEFIRNAMELWLEDTLTIHKFPETEQKISRMKTLHDKMIHEGKDGMRRL